MADQTCNPAIITEVLGIAATGPRTVIVPADPIIWDEGTSYEYLTLVASADYGQGYVSKKDVPSGTPLTDTEYWIPVAQYNAQLAQIQRELATINPSETFPAASKVSEGDAHVVTAGGVWDAIERSSEIVSLSYIGGKAGDATFDNSAVIAAYYADHPFGTLYVPEGDWYIKTRLDVENFNVWCDGYIVPSADFTSAFKNTIINSNELTVDGTLYTPVISATKDDEATTWLKDWIYYHNYKLNIDLRYVSHHIGFYINSMFGCDIQVNVRKLNVNIGMATSTNSVESHIKVNARGNAGIVSSRGVVNRTSDCFWDSIVVSEADIAVLNWKQEMVIGEFHPIDCRVGLAAYTVMPNRIGYYYADHLDVMFDALDPLNGSFNTFVDSLYVLTETGGQVASLQDTSSVMELTFGSVSMQGASVNPSELINNTYATRPTTVPIYRPTLLSPVQIGDNTFPDNMLPVTCWPFGHYLFRRSSTAELKTLLTAIGFPSDIASKFASPAAVAIDVEPFYGAACITLTQLHNMWKWTAFPASSKLTLDASDQVVFVQRDS